MSERNTEGRRRTGLEIPIDQLRPEILRAIIEEFVLREGTDYGLEEYSLDQKAAQVARQLEKGLAKVLYDEETESCTIVRVR